MENIQLVFKELDNEITLQSDNIYQNQRPLTFVWIAADFGAKHRMFLALYDRII